MNRQGQFPFHHLKYPLAKEEEQFETPFIEKVKHALATDLQKHDFFGCKINDCHTHAGSKIHFEHFIEAELLFHNNYYNEHFAQLTLKAIKQIVEKHETQGKIINNLLIVGYENYSELYLQKVEGLVRKEKSKISSELKQCRYCVYEINSRNISENIRVQEPSIKYLVPIIDDKEDKKGIKIVHGDEYQMLEFEKTLCVFIVPINTSLSTMDKMVAKFCADTKSSDFTREHICLITLGPKNFEESNEYWIKGKNESFIVPKENRFEYITKNDEILNFIFAETEWAIGKKCKKCFPDLDGDGRLEDEQPMFGVNRGSVVPMLKIGQKKYLTPINENLLGDKEKNLKRVWQLSKYMTYGHLVRNDNHFQYYFFTDKFLQSYNLHFSQHELDSLDKWEKENNESIKNFFVKIKSEFQNDSKKNEESIIFDFIVAPRHRTNAEWVHFVNEYVFDGQARIVYFDMDKEYRSNILSKYSDLISALKNIYSSKQNFYIRFHFVDDMINSGSTFLRAKNLITSLCSYKEGDSRISLFNSVILLVNRLSLDTQNFYLNSNRFFKFVDVNVSSMRRHDDACTLCKIMYDYQKIEEECATNNLAKMCSNVIERHKERDVLELENSFDDNIAFSKLEKRYIFFISHLLAERISNKLVFDLGKGSGSKVIDSESGSSEIKEILELFYDYDNAQNLISKYCLQKKEKNSVEDDKNGFLWQIAFIKTISRPFFIYHIRQRQASFSFCIEKLSELLNKNLEEHSQNNIEDNLTEDKISDPLKKSMMLQTLVKALSDMNANYLIRKDVLNNLIKCANIGDVLYEECKEKQIRISKENFGKIEKIKKRLLTGESLLHYLKKSIILSRDTSKSVLLEHILLTNSEDSFFGKLDSSKELQVNKFAKSGKNYVKELTLEGKIYLENNTIIKDVLGKESNLIKFEKINDMTKPLYFFSNFLEIWNLNLTSSEGPILKEDIENVFASYNELVKCIDEFKTEKDLSPKTKKTTTKDMVRQTEDDLCHETDKLFDSLLGEGKVRTQFFIHDKTEKNKLFQFFTLQGDPAKDKRSFECNPTKEKKCEFPKLTTTQAFYYDENLMEIRNIIDGSSDWTVCFINDSLKYKENGASAIIKFGNATKGKNVDESIYVQIWGVDTAKPTHWFAIKLLLSLRKNVIDLINRINLQELIEERKVDMQKNALSVNKATTHADAEKYFKEIIYLDYPKSAVNGEYIKSDFDDLREFINADKSLRYQYAQAMSINKKDYQFMLYDTYYQLLSDEFISSLYRGIIRGEKVFQSNINKKKYTVVKNTVRKHFCYDKEGVNADNSKFKTELYSVKGGKKIELKFDLDFSESDTRECNAWEASVVSINSIFYIINLMAMNVVQHGELKDGKYAIDIVFGKEGISFQSDIDKGNPDEINNYIKIYTHIPPWLFSENHTTLWTLVQSEFIDDKSKKEDKIKVDIKAKNKKFVVNLKLFN